MSEPSTSQNHHHLTTTTTTATTTVAWGTLEELLLACAVHRYGTTSWDSIAKELQTRTSLSHFTPLLCQQKYRDLKRRFAGNENDAVLCLDELRRLRVAELRRELHRYDLSIVSLQLKVKKLKEETENNNIINNNNNDGDKNKNENEKKIVINDVIKEEEEEVEDVKEEEKVDLQQKKEENNNNNKKEEKIIIEEKKEEAEGDTWNSAESTRSNNQKEEEVMVVEESSDVQSTVNGSDGNKEKKVGVVSGTSSGGDGGEEKENQTLALVEFLEVVRGRKLVSFFERRLLTQETPKYNNLIKQHIDLETIQKRLEEGQYTECQTKFYRDVMLLINNAIIFFSRRSPEHKAALELRHLLNKQFQTHVSLPHDQKSQPSKSVQLVALTKATKPEPNQAADLKQPKLTITGPVIACRKRSSIAGKSSRGGERKETVSVTLASEKLSSLGEKVKQQGEKTSSTSFNAVTKKRTRDQSFGSRSSSSKSNRNSSPSTPITGKGESSEAKTDKKKPSSAGNSSVKLRQGSGSGSNRGKGTLLFESLKNSDKQKPGNDENVGNVKSDRRKSEGTQNRSGSKLNKEKAKAKEERENTLSKERAKRKEEQESVGNRSSRRPPKRAAAIAAMGKRGRDGGGESQSQSKKRQRK